MIEKLKLISANRKVSEILFTLLILSFPFGSFFLSFSVGFMTVYPFLVLLVILSFLSFFMPKEKLNGIVKFYLVFGLLFFLYAIAFLPFVDGKSYAITDIRSIALMLMTTWVFSSLRAFLGFDKWREILLFSLKLIFILVAGFAIFEMVSGWHLAGEFTDKLSYRGIEDNMVFIPVFLWDNPNNFMVYVILISASIILLEPENNKKNYLVAGLLSLDLVFSIITEARIAILAVLIMIVIYAIKKALTISIKENKRLVLYVFFVIGALGLALGSNDIYKGIPKSRIHKIQRGLPLYPIASGADHVQTHLSKPGKPLLVILDDQGMDPQLTRNSKDERMALIKNGIAFVKESYFLGVGPGQYRYRHDQNQMKHFTWGNNGAHLWCIELISQYGIFIFAMYLAILLWVFVAVIKYFRKQSESAVGVLIGLVALVFVSALPSAFLILDIGWIFTAILILVVAELGSAKNVTG